MTSRFVRTNESKVGMNARNAACSKPMRGLLARLAVVLCSVAAGSLLLGCGSGSAESTSDLGSTAAASDERTGSVSLSLAVGNTTFTSVSYVIIGSNQFQTAGSLDVSHSSTISGIVGGIPFGKNYVVTLNAVSGGSGPTNICNGSTSFDISSEVPVTAAVHVTCKEQPLVAAAPAPVPPTAPLALGLLLLGLGVALQRRSSQPAS